MTNSVLRTGLACYPDVASPDKHYLDSITEGRYTGELPGNQRSFKMQNMSLQTIGLLEASLPLALPPVSTASYRHMLGDKLCQPCLGEDTARRKEATSSGAVVSDRSGWGGGVGEGWPDTGHVSKELGEGFLRPPGIRNGGWAFKCPAPSSFVVIFVGKISTECRLSGLDIFYFGLF